MILLSALALVAGPTFRSLNPKTLPPSTTKFDFVVVGDNRPVGAGMPATAVFKGLLKDIAWVNPAFVISSGDLVYGNEESLAQYKDECKEIKGLLNQLPCPFFNAPGNHEINGRPEFYNEYVKQFGATYGEFKFGGWQFLGVSTEEIGYTPGFSPQEMTWLKSELAKPGNKITFQHHPVYGRKDNAEEGAIVKGAEAVAAMYKEGGVKFAFEGHDHVYNHQSHDGVEYYISGGGGAPMDASPEEGGFFHFVIVHVDGDKVTTDTIVAGALQVEQTPDQVTFGNYAGSDIHIRNLQVVLKAKPTSVSASSFRKKKTKEVEIKMVGLKKVAGGYSVQLDFEAAKHRATVIKFKY